MATRKVHEDADGIDPRASSTRWITFERPRLLTHFAGGTSKSITSGTGVLGTLEADAAVWAVFVPGSTT